MTKCDDMVGIYNLRVKANGLIERSFEQNISFENYLEMIGDEGCSLPVRNAEFVGWGEVWSYAEEDGTVRHFETRQVTQ